MGRRSGWNHPWRSLLGVFAVVALVVGVSACSDDGDDSDNGASEGDVVGQGDTYEATIRRTTGDVPHISGGSIADVTFGQGWVSNEDHGCDLADQVLKVRGERARRLGPGPDDVNLDSDVAWRAIGIHQTASEDWETASDEVTELITSFTDGWNAHLEEVGADGLAGWCAGEDWVEALDPVDIYAYARSVALNASSTRVAEFIPGAAPPDEVTDASDSDEAAAPSAAPPPIASNGWAIGSDRSADGGGMLLANPHFPWEGELRFTEVHLTIPDELDAYGAQLAGLPGIGIGFTDTFGWTHTVSAGNRFTAYKLDLVPESPTTYHYGDEQREMTPTEHTIEVLGDDGQLDEVTRTTWASHYGPVIDFPGFGWTDEATITFRDANLDNDEFLEQYLGMVTAGDLDEFIEVHEQVNGVPLFNTIAASDDGRAWYADTSATPNLSDDAIAAYEAALEDDPIVKIAADSGAVLLDGSDPTFEWVDADGARDPGLVPFTQQPQLERDDYVFNANDSFWMAHATEMLEGDYSPLHGPQRTARSPRTRQNAVVLDDDSADGPAGDDGAFTLDELADASLVNEAFTAHDLRSDVVERCDGVAEVSLPAEDAPEPPGDAPPGSPAPPAGLPAADIGVGPACDVLAGWDGTYELDSVGPPVWREMIARFSIEVLGDAGPLWAEEFDPADPVATPGGLAPAPDGEPDADPVLVNLARAVQVLDTAGIPVDASLGEVQFALRAGERVPIHGGNGRGEGVTNVVGRGGFVSVLDPALREAKLELIAPDSTLVRVDGEAGYLVDNGTSFLLALAFTDDGPKAKAFLSYSNTEDRSADTYTDATEQFSAKQWREVAFTDDQIDDEVTKTTTVRG